ncbi:TolC family protein [Mucilaginibacter sp. 21P]|uniref:TolC family protein n=1 Tax=Mucilaginibacter sp. 21P TaxID=2778902 RepID=UPI001C55A188|nr:TolC family protein [Mucilaginibacter sp. 21P]QXV64247.1 TolC family protein [Mucilaginibacter sp. 21P]
MNRSVIKIILLSTGLFSLSIKTYALAALPQTEPVADTLKLTIKDAENRLLQNNLQFLAQKYNVNIAEAQVITAKLFPNPDFSFTNGIHATQVANAASQQSATLSQLIQTAGKRNNSIQLAKIGVTQSKYQLFDLLRTLRYTLRTDFYSIYYQQQSARVYQEEINSLAKTLEVFKQQYAAGNIAQKEVLRIQSQLYSLQGEYSNLLTNIDTTASEFKLLIRANPYQSVVPVIDDMGIDQQKLASVPYQQMIDSANVNRYDLRLAKSQVDYNNINLKLQKSMAVPDFSLSVNYDKLGSYGNNFIGAGIEFNLPFFNRNQGGIKQARLAISQSQLQLQSQTDAVQSQLSTYYRLAQRQEQLSNSIDPSFDKNFTRLIKGVFDNYQKRNISLLEFLDFYDSYKNTTLQINNLKQARMASLEQLNYVTGTPFFNNK